MDLIIKPTTKCNFNCTFCSASDISDAYHPYDGKVPKVLEDYIKKLNPDRLIITGGEPLTVPVEYYYNLHRILNDDRNISITSNLKDFYFNPEKWAKLFNEKWFFVTTSFNYGNSRMWDRDTVFSEDMFIKVYDLWNRYVYDKTLSFIAVIDEYNEDTAIDHVLLAKRLGTKVKLNGAISCGNQSSSYPRYKMFKHYIDIIKMGLDVYELNCYERYKNKCPRNLSFMCQNHIRCCYVDNDQNLHIGICDEQLSRRHEISEDFTYSRSDISIINNNCPSCELFALCNGCNTNREDAINDPNYCDEMKKLSKDIIKYSWNLYSKTEGGLL